MNWEKHFPLGKMGLPPKPQNIWRKGPEYVYL